MGHLYPPKIYSQTSDYSHCFLFGQSLSESVNPSTGQLSSVSPLPSSVSPLLLALWSLPGSPRPSAAPSQWGHLRGTAERLQEKSKMLVNNNSTHTHIYIYIKLLLYIYIYHIANNGNGIMMNHGVYSSPFVYYNLVNEWWRMASNGNYGIVTMGYCLWERQTIVQKEKSSQIQISEAKSDLNDKTPRKHTEPIPCLLPWSPREIAAPWICPKWWAPLGTPKP